MKTKKIKSFLGLPAKKNSKNSEFKIQNSKFDGRRRLSLDGQVLGTALIIGAVVLIFALAMVSMLSTTIKLRTKASSGSLNTLGADAAVDKAVEVLKEGNNWGDPVSFVYTKIKGFDSDTVYTDIPNTEYVVQISPGNLLSPPGDQFYERTVSVDMYTLPVTAAAVASPTPWTQTGGTLPSAYSNHRMVQAVFRRGSLNASIIAGGSIATNGNFIVYWGNVYDYYQPPGCTSAPCTTATTISLPHNQPLGSGYPAFHTQYGCISTKSANCGGCSGGSGSTSSSVCTVNDTGAVNPCGLYPNDPSIPPKPPMKLDVLRAEARAIYSPKSGKPGNPCSSGESGYFWDTGCGAPCSMNGGAAQVDSSDVTCISGGVTYTAGAPVQSNHNFSGGAFSASQATAVLARMAQNLGQNTSTWIGNDDLVFYVDTTNGGAMSTTDTSNWVNGSGSTDFTNFSGFRGTFVLLGSFNEDGHGSNSMSVSSPSASWCPLTASIKPILNGFLYIGGNYSGHGSPDYYGSIDLEGTFSGSGTPNLYYRSDFNYDLLTSGTVAMESWREIPPKSFPTPLP